MHNKLINVAKAFHPARLSALATYLLKDEAVSGKLILGATFLALVAVNTAGQTVYQDIWKTSFTVGLGDWSLSKDLQHWIDEGLMAIFYLVVGLELNRELSKGELKRYRTAALPFAAAIGGMVVPALIYIGFNAGSESVRGWAIPMATDIAFAAGVLAIIGRGIPNSIRLFLLTLAIVDDIGAVIVIALFYSAGIDPNMLGIIVGLVVILLAMRKLQILTMPVFIFASIGLWLAINASGIHASIAGALVGFLAPLAIMAGKQESIAERLERVTIPFSTLFVLPLFAFANTGIILGISSLESGRALPIAGGIVGGLVVGKVVGILGATWLMVRFGAAALPNGGNWRHIVGVGFLAGIGFTVSIFVTDLAFTDQESIDIAKLSIFVASAISGLLGLYVLRKKRAKTITLG